MRGQFITASKQGLNEAFVVDRTTRDRLIEEHESSQLLLKPYLRGRDIKKWNGSFKATDPVANLQRDKGTDIGQYPAIERQFGTVQTEVAALNHHGRTGSVDHATRAKPGSCDEFVRVWESSPTRRYLPGHCAESRSLDNIPDAARTQLHRPLTDPFVLGLLNSKLMWWFTRRSHTVRGGFVRRSAVRRTDPSAGTNAGNRRAGAGAAGAPGGGRRVAALEAAIDAAVYRLFGVAAGEIAVVEGQTNSKDATWLISMV